MHFTTERKKSALRVWAVAVWLVVWQLGSAALGQELLLPAPTSVLLRLGQLAVTVDFWASIVCSALRILGGFLLACCAAVLLAALAARFRRVRELLFPLVATMKAVPVMSFIILALVWITSANLSVLISFLMVFPPVYLNLLEGISHTDRQLLEMARVFHVPFSRQLKNLYVPQTLPYFRSACSLALGLCWKAGVAAEVIGLPQGTLGERLYSAKVYFKVPDLFAWTVTIVVVSAAFERLFLWGVDRALRKAGG